MAALAEMYVQGVSTRKVTAITKELCGHRFSASSISAINKGLDEALSRFANRPLDEEYPYLILDARYEKVRENGVIRSQAVQIAIGINREGQRQILAVELAPRETASSWKEFLLGLKLRGLRGVEFVVSDDHAGLRWLSERPCSKHLGSVATSIFCGMLWIICPVRPMTTVSRNSAGSTTAGTLWKPTGI